MKKTLFLLAMLLTLPVFSCVANSDSGSGNFIFSLGHKGMQSKGQVLFNSYATEAIAEGEKATISWSLNKTTQSFSIIVDGTPVSTSDSGEFEFYPPQSTVISVSLFDNTKNKIIEEHTHQINVYADPKITSLVSDREIAKSGTNVLLSWTGENLGSVSFSPAPVLINSGTAIVKPLTSTTYIMTATNPIGRFDTKEVSIKVSDYIPTITSFTIDKSQAYRGEEVNLTWTSIDSESVDFYIDGVLKASGLGVSGTYSYTIEKTGVQSFQMRAKDKFYGLYGLVEAREISIKESDSWDFLPRLKNTSSIKVGQSFDMEWSAGDTVKSITVSYKADNATDWTVLPITKLAGTYSLFINDVSAKKVSIKFDLIKANNALVSSTIVGSMITASTGSTTFYSSGNLSLNVDQGIDYPASVYINNVFNRYVYSDTYSIPLSTPGEYIVEIRNGTSSSSPLFSFNATVLPTWLRVPDLSRSIANAGDDISLSWSIPDPFKTASVKRTSNLGEKITEKLSASGSLSDKLAEGETYITYEVTVSTASGYKLTQSVSAYLLSANISVSEVSFGQSVSLSYSSLTPNKQLYIDGKYIRALSGSSYSITGLTVGLHNIEVKSTYGKFPENNRTWSKQITALPSTDIEIDSDFVVIQYGGAFNWSWSVPAIYDKVEVFENKGTDVLVSSDNQGTLASVMTLTTSRITLTIKASSKGGATLQKSKTVEPIYITGLVNEYNYTDSPSVTVRAMASVSVFINDVDYKDFSSSSSNTIPYSSLKVGVNEIRFVSNSSYSGEKQEITRYVTRLGQIILTADKYIELSGKVSGATWKVPAEYTTVKVTRGTAVVSSSNEGYHSASMPNSSVIYTVDATTKNGKTNSVSVTIYYYRVVAASEFDNASGYAITITSSASMNFYVYINGVDSATLSTSSTYNGKERALSVAPFNTGENELSVTPSYAPRTEFKTTVTKLSAAKMQPKVDYAYALIGKSIVYSWDVSTEYSIAKVEVTSNGVTKVVATGNSGQYTHTKSAYTETFTLSLETPSGYKYSTSLSAYPITVSALSEVNDYGSVNVTYSPASNSLGYKTYINGVFSDDKITSTKSFSVYASSLNEGLNEIEIIPNSSNVMGWKGSIRKLPAVFAESNYDIALPGTSISYTWDIPSDEYTTVKIESTVNNVKTVLPSQHKGEFTHSKSSTYSDFLTITATNSKGTISTKTVTVQLVKVSTSSNRITASQSYTLTTSGTHSASKVYINDKLYSSRSSLGAYTIGIGSFLTDGVNKIELRPDGIAGRVTSWFGTVTAYETPDFTTDYNAVAPGDVVKYSWSVNESQYKSVSLSYKGSSVKSTAFSGELTITKALADSMVLTATSNTNEVYTKAISVTDFRVSLSESFMYQGTSLVATYVTTDSSTNNVDIYVNGTKRHVISNVVDETKTTYVTSGFNFGDNEVKFVYTGTRSGSYKDYVVNVKRYESITGSADLTVAKLGDKVNLTWNIPSEYSSASIYTSLGDVISTSKSGEIEYTLPSSNTSGSITFHFSGKTPQNKTALISVSVLLAKIRVNNNWSSSTNSSVDNTEFVVSNGLRITFDAPFTGTSTTSIKGYIYINGVKRYDIMSNTSYANTVLSSSYFNYGENTLEIFSNTTLSNGLPTAKHSYYKGTATMLRGVTITSPTSTAVSGLPTSFSWSMPEEYTRAVVTANINGITSSVSTATSGTYEYTKSAVTDVLTVVGYKGAASSTGTRNTYVASFSADRTHLSTTQSMSIAYNLYSANTNTYADVYINGTLKTRLLSSSSVTGSYVIYGYDGLLEPGDNDIEVRYTFSNGTPQIWKASLYLAPTPVFSVDKMLVHLGDAITYTWSVDPIFTNVKFTLTQNNSTSTATYNNVGSSGSRTFLKAANTDSIKIDATGSNGISYSRTISTYYYSVLFPAMVASGQTVSYTLTSSYGKADIYINGAFRRSMTSDATINESPTYFNLGENTVEVVPTGTNASQSNRWTGKVIVAEAPEFNINYNLMHIGDVVTVTWDAPSIYTSVKITSSGGSGTKTLSSSGNSGTASFIKLKGSDSIKIEATNSSGASYVKTLDAYYMSVLFPATIKQGLSASYSFESTVGTASVYVNGVLIRNISTGSGTVVNYSIPSANLTLGNNLIEVIPTGQYAGTAKKWVGNIIVTE